MCGEFDCDEDSTAEEFFKAHKLTGLSDDLGEPKIKQIETLDGQAVTALTTGTRYRYVLAWEPD